MEAKLRHQQTILFYSGGATILFSFWSLVKHLFTLILNPPPWEQMFTQYDLSGLDGAASAMPGIDITKFIRGTGNSAMVFGLVVSMLVYVYLGISAIKDASGKKKRVTYIVISTLILIGALFSTALSIQSYMQGLYLFDNYAFYDERLTAIVIETFSQLSLLITIIAGCRTRWLRHKIAQAKTGE